MSSLSPRQLIAQKRDGAELSAEAIAAFVEAVTTGQFSPAQTGAMLMAVVLQGMTPAESAALTLAMRDSGAALGRPLDGPPRIDKHSTGGVGDKVSLVLAPLVAACGLTVPMISGRGLGHTGGTLDKLESIPGFRCDLSIEAIEAQVNEIGLAIAAQTPDLVPADRILYAVRDVTATVESIALVTASILSKKLAEGLDGLVLDVKFGAGAFFPERSAARELACSLVRVATAAGCPTVALLSSMEEPLGRAVGNALEVAESIACLRGEGPEDLEALCLALGSEMLCLADPQLTPEAARGQLQAALFSGAALDKFFAMVKAQGGDSELLKGANGLPEASLRESFVHPGEGGYLARVDARRVAEAAALLGAGRQREADAIDPAVGIVDLAKVGQWIDTGALLCTLHANTEQSLEAARALLQGAFLFASEPVARPDLISEIITSDGLSSELHGAL